MRIYPVRHRRPSWREYEVPNSHGSNVEYLLTSTTAAFYLNKANKRRENNTIYFTYRGSDPEPAYSLRYPDLSSPQSKNRYAAALFDPYVPSIVYGEVLLIPEWTRPTLSAEAIRQNGGIPPPPEPILPSQFTIQLYNPDQQVTVHYKPKSWNSPATWAFEMPQRSFRQPSSSKLDRTQSDPAVSEYTPKLKFSWRRDGKLTKDLSCLLSGMTTTSLVEPKTKRKEPDITISFFRSLREITLYEPNLYRVEMEDFKGLELVLMLGAVVIRDVYFSPLREAFNVSDPPTGAGKVKDAAAKPAATSPTGSSPLDGPVASGALNGGPSPKPDRPQRPHITIPQEKPQRPPSPVDIRSQEEIQAEKVRMQQRREWAAQEEQRRTRKLLEAEEKARRRRQVEVDKETKRLQKLYGEEERRVLEQQRLQHSSPGKPATPPRSSQNNCLQQPQPQHQIYRHHNSASVAHLNSSSPYLQGPLSHSSVQLFQPPHLAASMHSNGNGLTPQMKKKSSFFGFRKSPDEAKLSKKRSSMF